MRTQQSPSADQCNLTTRDVAQHYGLTEWGVRRMVRAGKIRAVNIGTERRRILRFSTADL